MWRTLGASCVGIASAVGLGAAMLPIRSHLALATAALVLVVPVVVGVALGGWLSGLASVLGGFLVYDYAFVPPYGTLQVGAAQNWAALGVYVVVMIVVARLVDHLRSAQDAARARATSARHLLDLSELMALDASSHAEAVVTAIRDAFDIEGVILLQPRDGRLAVVASAGTGLSEEELARLRFEGHRPVPLTTSSSSETLQTLALSSPNHPIGLLALRNTPSSRAIREALPVLANHLASALERAELQERAHEAELLEEVDRLRQALVGAVSHDLRTPLATIKVASSTLVGAGARLPIAEADELHRLIDQQADRLSRLVNNLLDMTRIEAGALEVRRGVVELHDLVAEVLSGLRSALEGREVKLLFEGPTLVEVDPLLVGQVLANLIDNANRHAPPDTALRIEVGPFSGEVVTVAVVDNGPGVPVGEHDSVFETFTRFDTGGRSGLGLAIAKAFIEAHGNRIWAEDEPGGGARFCFTLPLAKSEPAPQALPTQP